MPKTNRNIFKFSLIFILFLFILSLLSAFHIHNTWEMLNIEAKFSLEEVTKKGSNLIEKDFDNDLDTLKIISNEFMAYPDIPLSDKLKRLNLEANRLNCTGIGYADLDGNAILSDGTEAYIGDRDYFINALKGNETISDLLVDKTDLSKHIVVCSVPINFDGKITGVLFISNSMEQLSSKTSLSFFDNQGYSYIINNKGDIILNPNQSTSTSNIFDLMKNSHHNYIDNFMTDLSNNASGVTRLMFNNIDTYIGYSPIDGTENWSLISIIPTDVFFDNSEQIMNQVLLLSVILIFIFLCIIISLYFNQIKNNKLMYDLAFTDKTTGLSNYNKFIIDYNAKSISVNSKKYALIYFDIDNFKLFNDTLGYEFGNSVLKFLSTTLEGILLNNEIYARLSNDHFAIFLEYKNHSNEIIELINTINNSLTDVEIENHVNIDIVLSLGIYLVDNVETDINKMLNNASIARSSIKGNQHIHYAFFNENIKKVLSSEIHLVNEMKVALLKNQFEVYYQPKFSLTTNEIVGLEALIRWKHPTLGFISPATFIPLAEKSGFIIDIGRFVFDSVFNNLTQWQESGFNKLPVSINISRVELYQTDLIEFLDDLILKYNVDINLIEIEITETAAINDLLFTNVIVEKFKNLGFKISMDDFGTGYSSLSFLRSIPIDILKLDKTFLDDIETDPRSKNIATAIINLAKSLNLTVVSEGIETAGQAEFLKLAGCDIAQGFYFARPMPNEELLKLMASNSNI
ncbi:MAG: EAL domain-containing protein [Clostridium sp.]|uniref:bifunctional diguanylate cyclase/phosphodiesterase n=1 Tax=Clostridium sp. TaxID=1506 RepID=UPI00321628FA